MSDLLEVEKWPCYDLAGNSEGHLKQALATRDFFACSLCLKIRCASKFSNAMMKGKRGKHSAAASAEKDERSKRFCIDCGMRYGKCLPGVDFDFGRVKISDGGYELGGGHGVVCPLCCQFKRVSGVLRPYKRTCQACLGGMRQPWTPLFKLHVVQSLRMTTDAERTILGRT
ncbi:hypothetical protein GJ744_007516 [Endocarpon pusillum]|uniref:Uncharacterized protein n=1 Tax=Endocarpon pusillum TaxID=364733 RepID=A0A8H7A7K5_9EURO|nr:hypothetical protein GJ744_007516 [Endocarpon pusillum]